MTLGRHFGGNRQSVSGIDGVDLRRGLCGLLSGLPHSHASNCPTSSLTIGVGSIATGMAFIYGVSIFSSHFFSSGILRINDSMLWIAPLPVVILAVTAAVVYYLLHMSRYGQSFYAVRGESPSTARLSGVTDWHRISRPAFAICGAAVGLAIILNVAAVGAASVNAGSRVLLPAYTAVYLEPHCSVVPLFRQPLPGRFSWLCF